MAAAGTAEQNQSTVSLRITLPADVYRLFESRAELLGIDVDEAIVRHVASTRDQNQESGRQLKLSVEERQTLESAFGRSFRTGQELHTFLLQVYSMQVGNVRVQLSPDLLRRLEGRRGRQEFNPFVIETVVRQLEHFVGLR